MTAESTSSHQNSPRLPLPRQCSATIPARVYLDFTIRGDTRAEVSSVRSAGRRHARLKWAGSVQCAAVRQIKPNHESCDKSITWAALDIFTKLLLLCFYNIAFHTLKFVRIGKSLLEREPGQFHRPTQTSSIQLPTQVKHFLEVPLLKSKTALIVRVQSSIHTSG